MTEIFELSDRAVDLIADADPLAATESGITGRDHLWPDLSVAGYEARRSMWTELLSEARAATGDGRDADVARAVLVEAAEMVLARIDDRDHLCDLNNIESLFQEIKDVFDVMARGTADAWNNIVTRLDTIGRPLTGYRKLLSAGRDHNLAVARRQVLAVLEEGRLAAGNRSPFFALIDELGTDELDAAGPGSDRDRHDLEARLVTAIATARAAFADFCDWLEADYLPSARPTDPVGRTRYGAEAVKHLGMEIDLEATYTWGWNEIDRLGQRMAAVCASIDPDKSVAEVIEMLSADPDRAAPDVEQYISTMQAVQDRAVRQLSGTHFDVPEDIRHVEVKVSPPGGALAPYYTPPSEDFSRPGSVWYPIGSRTTFPLWDEMSTAYHEGFPGHHLQMGVQFAMGDRLSRFHRLLVWWPGSGEGWALYAEHLMGELGFHDRPEYELGMLVAQLMRSCRVVIDIGSHCEFDIPSDASFHPGEPWSFDLAVEMLRDVAHQSEEMSRSEVTRYLGWPGQAISYKLGEQVILDLRHELAADENFDLRQFHTQVLSVGSIGLDLLKELVRNG